MKKKTTNNPLDALEALASQRSPKTDSLRRALRGLFDRLAGALEAGDEASAMAPLDSRGFRTGPSYRVRRCEMYTGELALRLSRSSEAGDDSDTWEDDSGAWIDLAYVVDGKPSGVYELERKHLLGLARAARSIVDGFRKQLENEAVAMAAATASVTQLVREIDELAVVRGVMLP